MSVDKEKSLSRMFISPYDIDLGPENNKSSRKKRMLSTSKEVITPLSASTSAWETLAVSKSALVLA